MARTLGWGSGICCGSTSFTESMENMTFRKVFFTVRPARRAPRGGCAGFLQALLLAASALAGCVSGERPNPGDDNQRRPVSAVRLSGEPIVTIGVVEGLDEYQFFDISGAARLADGSVVVAESGARRV